MGSFASFSRGFTSPLGSAFTEIYMGANVGGKTLFNLYIAVTLCGLFIAAPSRAFLVEPSNCPQALTTKRFAQWTMTTDKLSIESLLEGFSRVRRKKLTDFIRVLQGDYEQLQAESQSEFLSEDRKKELREQLKNHSDFLTHAKQMMPNRQEELDDYGEVVVQETAQGGLLAWALKVAAYYEMSWSGYSFSLAEELWELTTLLCAYKFPQELINKVPLEIRATIPEKTKNKLVQQLTLLSGKPIAPGLVERLWTKKLAREGLMDRQWGRMEIYWQLIQRNPSLDLREPKDRTRVQRLVDLAEDLLTHIQ